MKFDIPNGLYEAHHMSLLLMIVLILNFVERAAFVEHEDGKMVLLNPNNPQQREAVAKRLLTPHHSQDLLNKSKKVRRMSIE